MRQAHRAEVPQTYYQTPVPIDVLTLSYNQACILEYLCDAGGLTSYRDIHVHTSIKMPSARDAIARLVTKGFMSSPETQRNASFQGFSYVLNKVMCDHFLAAGGLERKNYQTGHQTVRQSDNQTVEQSHRLSPHSSSEVSSETKPTTTTPPSDPQTVSPSDVPAIRPSDAGDFVLAGPESAYWEDIGLQERQALKWCEDFEVRPADMRQQLAWARWDLVQNGKEADVTKDPISWFFGCLRKTAGCYPRPENYQSPAELRARQLKLQQDKDAEARSAVVSAEAVEDFQRLMADPQSSNYIELYEQVSDFAREQGGFCLELAMKDLFLEKKGLNKTDGCN